VFTAHSYAHLTQVALQGDNAIGEEERFELISALVEAALRLSSGGLVLEKRPGIPSPAVPQEPDWL
jgi:hypothetical protein